MSDPSNHPAAPLTMEEGVDVLIGNARQRIRERYRNCEDRIRKSPGKAVLAATAAGYLMHRLPLRAIVVTQVRILSALAPPALLLVGAGKLFEFLQGQKLRKRK